MLPYIGTSTAWASVFLLGNTASYVLSTKATRRPYGYGRDLMMKVEYNGYRIWAILQTSGRYRAWFFNSPVAAMDHVIPVIEGHTEAEAINKAVQFLDGIPELYRPRQRRAVARRRVG
jgi:hypothetical protein